MTTQTKPAKRGPKTETQESVKATLQTRISAVDMQRLERLAERRRQPFAWVVREVLKSGLIQHEGEGTHV